MENGLSSAGKSHLAGDKDCWLSGLRLPIGLLTSRKVINATAVPAERESQRKKKSSDKLYQEIEIFDEPAPAASHLADTIRASEVCRLQVTCAKSQASKMSATSTLQTIDSRKRPTWLLLLCGALLISLNQRCVLTKRLVAAPIPSNELDQLSENLVLQTREINRTRAHVSQSASASAHAAPTAGRKHQMQAQLSDPLALGASSESQVIAAPKSEPGAKLNAAHLRPVAASNQPNATSLSSVRQKWRQLEQSLGSSLARASGELRTTLDQLLAGQEGRPLPVSAQCRAGLSEFVSALGEQELWASQMLDASATRLPKGLLEGTLTELGHFDECLAVANNQRTTTGQYCSLQIKPALVNRPRLHTICRRLPSLVSGGGGNSSSSSGSGSGSGSGSSSQLMRFLSQNSHQFLYVGLRLGICVPGQCKTGDVQLLLSAYLAPFELIGQVKQCEKQERHSHEWRPDANSANALSLYLQQAYISSSILHKFDSVQQCILLAFCALLLLIALGTWLERGHTRPSALKCATQRDSASASSGAAPPRRWQEYQVCRSASGAGSSAPTGQLQSNLAYLNSEPSANQHKVGPVCGLGLQRNPIADFIAISPPSLTPDSANTPSSSSSCMLDNHDLERLAPDKQRARAYMRASDINNNAAGGEALAAADRSLTGASHRESTGKKQSARASDERSVWAQLLICFSLTNNLRAVGKLSGGSSEARTRTYGADIKVIHGLRTLSMIWIIFGHTIGLVGPEMMNTLFPLAQLSCSSRLLQALLNATLAVDTFFMISGLVTAISFVRKCTSAALLMNSKSASQPDRDDLLTLRRGLAADQMAHLRRSAGADEQQERRHQANAKYRSSSVIDLEEISSVDSTSSAASSFSSPASSKRCISSTTATSSLADKKCVRARGSRPAAREHGRWPSDFQPLKWLLMRYLRLTPAYASLIGISILLPALGSGPFWAETVGQLGPACRANWWTNLVYLNNFLETDKLCLIHSWYLSNDWQFFLLTLLLFGLFYKSRKLTVLLLVSLILASSAATLISTIDNDFPPTIVTTSPAVAERWQFIHQLYYKPWPHLPAYLVGLITGYAILQQEISQKQQLSRAGRLLCWTLFSLIGLAVLNSIYPWNMGIQVEPLLTGLHSATFRTLWAASCAWLVFALVTRPRNPLSLFLGWRGFQLTSRLTYCAYLVHPLVIYYHFGSLRERIDSSPYGQLHRFMATLALSYLFALLLSILVESPSIQLQRFFARLGGPERGQASSRKAANKPKEGTRKHANSHSDQYWATTNSEDINIKAASDQISPAPLHTDQAKSNFHHPAGMAHHHHHHPCEHLMSLNNNDHNADMRRPCQLHHAAKDRSSSQSSSHSGSALDVEFQKKLAQAIGRGFKIRTKIVNGPAGVSDIQQSHIRHQAACRPNQYKRPVIPKNVALLDVTPQCPTSDDSAADSQGLKRDTKVPPPLPPAKPLPVSKRLNDQFSTFMACQAQHYTRATSRKTVESNVEHLSECCVSLAGKQQAAAAVRNHVDLTEMVQLKHKLLTTPQDVKKSVA